MLTAFYCNRVEEDFEMTYVVLTTKIDYTLADLLPSVRKKRPGN